MERKTGTFTQPDGTVVTFEYDTNPRAFEQQDKYTSSGAWDQQGAPAPVGPPPQPIYSPMPTYDTTQGPPPQPSYNPMPTYDTTVGVPPQPAYNPMPTYDTTQGPPPQPAYIPLPSYNATTPPPPVYGPPAPYRAAPIPPQYNSSAPPNDPSRQVVSMPSTMNPWNIFDAYSSMINQGWGEDFAREFNGAQFNEPYPSYADYFWGNSDKVASPYSTWVVADKNDGYASAELTRAQPSYNTVMPPPPTVTDAAYTPGNIPAAGGMATTASADYPVANEGIRYRDNGSYWTDQRDRRNRRDRNNRRGR